MKRSNNSDISHKKPVKKLKCNESMNYANMISQEPRPIDALANHFYQETLGTWLDSNHKQVGILFNLEHEEISGFIETFKQIISYIKEGNLEDLGKILDSNPHFLTYPTFTHTLNWVEFCVHFNKLDAAKEFMNRYRLLPMDGNVIDVLKKLSDGYTGQLITDDKVVDFLNFMKSKKIPLFKLTEIPAPLQTFLPNLEAQKIICSIPGIISNDVLYPLTEHMLNTSTSQMDPAITNHIIATINLQSDIILRIEKNLYPRPYEKFLQRDRKAIRAIVNDVINSHNDTSNHNVAANHI